MKKLLVASAVSAALAAPAAVMAQQGRVPTLGQVLDASGISVNGYIDAGYNWANRNIEAGFANPVPGTAATPRVFDNQNNSFSLHQFGLTVAKQPKEGFGGLVNLTVGKDAEVIHSFPESGNSSTFDMTQAYLSYSQGSVTVIGGKFTTLAGTEVIASTGNVNISRSILFGAVPFTHTGVRASYAPSDTITVYGGLNNGWDQLQDQNRPKTLELGATFNPVKPLTMTLSGYFGSEPVVVGNAERDLLDFVANYIVSNSLSFGAEYLTAKQDDFAPGQGSGKYQGLALYGSAMLNQQWRASVRGEYFDDKNGLHFFTTNGAGALQPVKYYEGTLTLAYLPTKDVELRTEVRADKANQSVYIDSNGSTKKTLMTFGLEGLYKF
ncbi:MAG TPA: outer membrane beta-barrel protein [Burkholderiales bacterium]|nr:outer membrane beta-barrel protein [Burkholderiales bacterium]